MTAHPDDSLRASPLAKFGPNCGYWREIAWNAFPALKNPLTVQFDPLVLLSGAHNSGKLDK
jgi:hypothetical protein